VFRKRLNNIFLQRELLIFYLVKKKIEKDEVDSLNKLLLPAKIMTYKSNKYYKTRKI